MAPKERVRAAMWKQQVRDFQRQLGGELGRGTGVKQTAEDLRAERETARGSAHGVAWGPHLDCGYPKSQPVVVKMSMGCGETMHASQTV